MDEAVPSAAPPMNPVLNFALGLAGGLAGGALGYLAFGWLLRQGFYALALPGVLMGLGAGLSARRSIGLACVCGVLALALSLFAEWKHFPFRKDESFGYFLSHLSDLRPLTMLMIGVGSAGGFWFAWRGRAK
jgi:hypothetical protein